MEVRVRFDRAVGMNPTGGRPTGVVGNINTPSDLTSNSHSALYHLHHPALADSLDPAHPGWRSWGVTMNKCRCLQVSAKTRVRCRSPLTRPQESLGCEGCTWVEMRRHFDGRISISNMLHWLQIPQNQHATLRNVYASFCGLVMNIGQSQPRNPKVCPSAPSFIRPSRLHCSAPTLHRSARPSGFVTNYSCISGKLSEKLQQKRLDPSVSSLIGKLQLP